MNESLISIVVPIYNAENYLKKCVDSLRNQSYRNIEIILVDDGSPDNCGKICDEYARLDERIKVIHKENGGLSSARNAGIINANGGYIGFVDADDYVKDDMYERLYRNLKETNSDISICGTIQVFDEREVIINKKNIFFTTINMGEAIDKMYSFDYYGSGVCDKLFLKSFFDDTLFPEGKKSEDMFIMYKIFAKAKGIVFDSNPGYCYVQHKNSITHDVKNINSDSVEAIQGAIEFMKNNFPNNIGSAYRMYAFSNIGVYDKFLLIRDKANKKIYRDNIKNIFKKIDFSGVRGLRLLQLILIRFFPHIYDICFKVYYKRKNLI